MRDLNCPLRQRTVGLLVVRLDLSEISFDLGTYAGLAAALIRFVTLLDVGIK